MIDDLLAPGLKVVFCGTALSKTSYQQSAYYAHPGNKFYAVLFAEGFTDRQLKPHEYKSLLTYGIGLTDVNKTEYGQDSELSAERFDPGAVKQKILHYQPGFLAFTSKRAAQAFFGVKVLNYGEVRTRVGAINNDAADNDNIASGKTRFYVLPSTSGRASRYWDTGYWQRLSALISSP